MSNIESITVIRHFRDVDNLIANGTDNPLAPGQEDKAIEFGNQLSMQAKAEGYRGIVLITSPKKRAVETARIIQEGVSEAKDPPKTKVVVNYNLRELDQGILMFPPDYKPGMYFEPLTIAWNAFWEETFASRNLLYRFGSPYSRGQLCHPELQGYFSSYGECYRDHAVRLYSSVYDFGQRLNRFRYFKPIVVTHDAPRVIFKELEFIAKQIQEDKIVVSSGGLAQLTWDTYSGHEPSHLAFGEVSILSTLALSDPKVKDILYREINILKQLS